MAMTRRGVWSEATDQCLHAVSSIKVERSAVEGLEKLVGETASACRLNFG
jgi:hypothetical protein